MFFYRVSRFSIAAIASVFLGACGGGGGGGSSSVSSPSTPATAEFPIADAYASQLINGFSSNVYITGSVSGTTFSGSGTISVSPATSGTFEGQSGILVNTISLIATVTVNGTAKSINSSATGYSDSNYNPLGSLNSDGTYSVVTSSSPLPTVAHVYDTGPISTATNYTNSAKTTIDTTTVETYAIEPDSETSVIYDVIDKDYDTNNALVTTTHDRYRVTTSGVITYVSSDYQSADGSETEHVVAQ